jgi:hypothetical protein
VIERRHSIIVTRSPGYPNFPCPDPRHAVVTGIAKKQNPMRLRPAAIRA